MTRRRARGGVHVRPRAATVRPARLVRSGSPRRPSTRLAVPDDAESSLLDVLDNLLNRGVVLNADVILALADVDLVYVRLSALLCAADRLLPGDDR